MCGYDPFRNVATKASMEVRNQNRLIQISTKEEAILLRLASKVCNTYPVSILVLHESVFLVSMGRKHV